MAKVWNDELCEKISKGQQFLNPVCQGAWERPSRSFGLLTATNNFGCKILLLREEFFVSEGVWNPEVTTYDEVYRAVFGLPPAAAMGLSRAVR